MSEYDELEIRVSKFKKLPSEEWLPAELERIVLKDGKYGPMYVFTFKPTGEDYENQTVRATVSADVSNNPNTKTYKWYSSLLNRELEEGECIKLKALKGKAFEIFIEDKIVGDKSFQNVTKVRASKVKEQKVVEKETKKVQEEEVEKSEEVKELNSVDEEELDLDELHLDDNIPL